MAKEKIDIHAEITDKFISALESGVRPWVKPWASSYALPTRGSTGDAYRGINILLLEIAAMGAGYSNPNWLTFKQAKDIGGMVRKGEKGTKIVYYKQLKVKDKATQEDKMIPMIRGYVVFNVEQIDGLDSRFDMDNDNQLPESERNLVAEQAMRDCGAVIHTGGDRAFYSPSEDSVTLPEFSKFNDANSYLATMAHELTHWTGHESRMARFGNYGTGKTDYAFEELVAEIGAAMICARLNVNGENFDNHAAYVNSWIKCLKSDKKFIFKAASKAQEAADIILGK